MTHGPAYYRDLLNRILIESDDIADSDLRQRQFKRKIAKGLVKYGKDYVILNSKIILNRDILVQIYNEPRQGANGAYYQTGWYVSDCEYIDGTPLTQLEIDQLEDQEPGIIRSIANNEMGGSMPHDAVNPHRRR